MATKSRRENESDHPERNRRRKWGHAAQREEEELEFLLEHCPRDEGERGGTVQRGSEIFKEARENQVQS